MNIYENTHIVQQEASSRRHIGSTGNDAHPRVSPCSLVLILDLACKGYVEFVRCELCIAVSSPQTALDTGRGKDDMYINVPFAPPPTSVQGLRKTLAKRKCVELPRGALK